MLNSVLKIVRLLRKLNFSNLSQRTLLKVMRPKNIIPSWMVQPRIVPPLFREKGNRRRMEQSASINGFAIRIVLSNHSSIRNYRKLIFKKKMWWTVRIKSGWNRCLESVIRWPPPMTYLVDSLSPVWMMAQNLWPCQSARNWLLWYYGGLDTSCIIKSYKTTRRKPKNKLKSLM